MSVGHVLDYVLGHIIIHLVNTALQYLKASDFRKIKLRKLFNCIIVDPPLITKSHINPSLST